MRHGLIFAISSVILFANILAACSEPDTRQITPSPKPSVAASKVSPTPQSTSTPTPFPTITPTPFPTVTATPPPTTSPFIKPAQEPTATPAPAPTEGSLPLGKLTEFEDTTLGFAVQYPDDWSAFAGNINLGNTLFVAQGELGLPRLLINLNFATEITDTETQASKALATLSDVLETKVLHEGKAELEDGTDAYAYSLLVSGEVELGTRLAIITRGSQIFEVYAQTVWGDFEGRLPELNQMIKSFRLTEPTPFGVPRDSALTLQKGSPSILDPHLITDATSYSYLTQIFGGLVTLDSELTPVPDLAESWKVSNGGLTYEFHLRTDVKFHDGRKVTATDVKYSLERAADPDTASTTANLYLNDIVGVTEKLATLANEISGVTIVNDYTLRIDLTQPVPYFLSKMTHPVAFVVDKANIESGNAWFFEPNGTGPFKLRGWKPGLALVLDRNDQYHRTPAKVPHVLFWHIGANPFLMYKTGELDVANIFVNDVAKAKLSSSGFTDQLVVNPELTVFYLGINMRVAPFDDPRSRKAFAMAADVTAIVKKELFNAYPRAKGIMPIGLPGHNSALESMPFDPVAAKALWDQVLEEKSLAPSEIKIKLATAGVVNKVLIEIAQAWSDNLGVEVSLLQIGGISDFTLEATNAQFFETGWVADYPDPQNFLDILFHSKAPNNYGNYNNPLVDKLIEEARSESDKSLRVQMYQQAENLLVQDAATIPMWFTTNYSLVKPDVLNWSLSAQDVPDLVGVSLTRILAPLPTPTPVPTPKPTPSPTPGGKIVTV